MSLILTLAQLVQRAPQRDSRALLRQWCSAPGWPIDWRVSAAIASLCLDDPWEMFQAQPPAMEEATWHHTPTNLTLANVQAATVLIRSRGTRSCERRDDVTDGSVRKSTLASEGSRGGAAPWFNHAQRMRY
ncbi:hypothetical protein [Actinomadura logoneensis]|uniref:hypothetical protein n=1 Tax=Actinomadura logoneensis TaxID=2293572 RepID=UPI0011C1B6FC|nr:hypothetical protein [Actinomadura logoneensis]